MLDSIRNMLFIVPSHPPKETIGRLPSLPVRIVGQTFEEN